MKQTCQSVFRMLGLLLWLGITWAAWGLEPGLMPVGHDGRLTSNPAGALAVLGQYAYLGESSGLAVLDVTLTTAPQVVCRLPLADQPRQVKIANGRAYVAGGTAGLLIYDLADPANPTLRADYQTTGSVQRVAVDGARACIASNQTYMDDPLGSPGEMQVLDVSDPATPRLLGRYNPYSAYGSDGAYGPGTFPEYPLHIRDVALANGRAILGVNFDGPHIIDLADPTVPRFIGRLNAPGWFTWMTVAEGRLYAIGVEAGDMVVPKETISIFDLADTATLRLLGSTQRVSGHMHAYPLIGGLAVADGKLYYSVANQLRVMDVSQPAIPRLLARATLGNYTGYITNQTDSVAPEGRRIYMVNDDGLHVLTLGDWEKGTVLRSTSALDTAWDLAIIQDTAFIRDGTDLKAFQIDNPTTLPLQAALPLTDGYIVAVTSLPLNYGVGIFQVTATWINLYHLDWPPTFSPAGKMAWTQQGGMPRDAAVQKIDEYNTLFGVICEDTTLTSGTLFLFTEGSYNLRMTGTLTLPHRLGRVWLAGDRALLAWQDDPANPATSGLTLVDLGDLAQPSKSGELPLAGTVLDLAYQAPFAYVLVKGQGLRVIDFTDPSAPKLRGTYNTPAGATALSIQVNGPEAWLACGGNTGSSIIKLDVSDPDHPALLRMLPLDHPADGMDLAMEDGRLYLVSRGTQPGNPAASRFEVLDGPLRELTAVGPLPPSTPAHDWALYE